MNGTGVLAIEDVPSSFEKGDVLFVPAGKRHRFVEFSADFVTWAVFWGPTAGE
jgi:mannose-6-phosphate isomerase-like protein (cupin superfamily)